MELKFGGSGAGFVIVALGDAPCVSSVIISGVYNMATSSERQTSRLWRTTVKPRWTVAWLIRAGKGS
jgi:hypothetical protein